MLSEELANLFVEIQFKFNLEAAQSQLNEMLSSLADSVKPITVPIIYRPTGEIPQPPGMPSRDYPYNAAASTGYGTPPEGYQWVDDPKDTVYGGKKLAPIVSTTGEVAAASMLSRFRGGTGRFMGGMGSMAEFGIQAALLMEGIEVIKESLSYNNQLQTIKQIVGNQQQFQQIKGFIQDLSQQSGTSLEAMGEGFRPSLLAIRQLGGTNQDAEKYFSTLSLALGAMGANSQISKIVYGDAIREFLDTNKIQLSRISRSEFGTEFGLVQRLERLPEFKGESTKKIEKQLDAMTISQKIDILVEALENLSPIAENRTSLTKSFTILQNSLLMLGESFIEIISTGNVLANVIKQLASLIAALAKTLEIVQRGYQDIFDIFSHLGNYKFSAFARKLLGLGKDDDKSFAQDAKDYAHSFNANSFLTGFPIAQPLSSDILVKNYGHYMQQSGQNPVKAVIEINNNSSSHVNVASKPTNVTVVKRGNAN